MQNRSFQAYLHTLYSNKEQYRVCLNPITDMWELRSAQGRRLNASRDIFVLAQQIQDKDTLIIPKDTEHVSWLPDSVFNEIQEYSLLIQTYLLVGETDFSHIKPPESYLNILKLSREQLISLGFTLQSRSLKHPDWYFKAYMGNLYLPFYAENPFT